MKTSKKESCYNQIVAAIDHFQKEQIDCAITLAAAAEGMLSTEDHRYLFREFRDNPEAVDIDLNSVINWLKHPGEPELANITELEAAFAIARAITKFIAAYHQSAERFERFLRHVHESGVLPIKLYR
jgi:hypothetical protein